MMWVSLAEVSVASPTPDRVSQATREARPWHALEAREVAAALDTSPDGLPTSEIEPRRERYGPNRLEEIPPPGVLEVLVHQFTSPLIYILLVATVVTLLLQEWVDAGVIAAVLILNAVIGFIQERRAEASVRGLMQLIAPHARVIRDGREHDVEGWELVPGDLVLLESGVRVSADLRLAGATALAIDESLLTGESTSVSKHPRPVDEPVTLADRTCMAFSGSIVASGRGRGYVVATGTATELGKIAGHVREEVSPQTPLQKRMGRFAQIVGIVIGVASLMSFGIGVAIGESVTEMFKVAVALAVAAIPEGLPVVFTIALALGVRRMARRKAIIRRLPAVETLGSTTVIGSDKTGTLTENRMTVREVWSGGRTVPLDDDGAPSLDGIPAPDGGDPLAMTVLAGVLTNEADVYEQDGELKLQGDPTESALLVAASHLGLEPPAAREAYHVVAEIPFEAERRYSASLRRRDGRHAMFVKGAPERVLDMCTRMLTDDGVVDVDPDAVKEASRAMARRGLRVLGMAMQLVDEPPVAPGADAPDQSGDEAAMPERRDLVFCGLQGMQDPPREGVKDAIAGCHRAGIRVVMITGDHALTARAIARDLDIAEADADVLTGVELESLSDEELRDRVRDTQVFARVDPEHKLRVVRALRHHGDVVAVTGDGVNDAPALKAADIGVAMGKSGTDVAREASDMVLSDDNFVSIYAAVEEGRVAFDNLRKVTFFLISSGAGTVIAILATLVAGWPLPLIPAQILWLNLVTNGIQDVALAFEPGEPDVLERKPRPAEEGVISRLLWERTVVAGIVMAAIVLFAFRWELDHGATVETARTVALTTLVLTMAFHAGNSRSEHRSVFALNPFSNRVLLVGVVAALAVHAAALYLPFTQFVLRVEPLDAGTWLWMLALATPIVVAMELHKWLRRSSLS
jgi:magnesium-transporting ATPase (P-type)